MTEQLEGNSRNPSEIKQDVIQYLSRMIVTLEQEHITVSECIFDADIALAPAVAGSNWAQHLPTGGYKFTVEWVNTTEEFAYDAALGYTTELIPND